MTSIQTSGTATGGATVKGATSDGAQSNPSQLGYLEFGPNDGLYYEYDAPSPGKPTLVFVNALTGNTAGWQAEVAPRCRETGLGTLCWNFRGQADSPFSDGLELNADLIVSDLTTLLKEVAPPNPILIGLSIGGLYASRAILEGARAEGLVLLNTLRRIGRESRGSMMPCSLRYASADFPSCSICIFPC